MSPTTEPLRRRSGPDAHSRPRRSLRGVRAWPRRKVWVVGGVLAILAAVALVWFQPQKLLYSDRVDEGLPEVAQQAESSVPGQRSAAAAQPVELASGDFVSREHQTRGSARVLRLADGRVIVRFEDFATSNGPVLVVWLSKNPARGPAEEFDDEYVLLGALKGNIGNQNYTLPGDVDSAAFASVVVWCDRFNVPFGAADLHPSA